MSPNGWLCHHFDFSGRGNASHGPPGAIGTIPGTQNEQKKMPPLAPLLGVGRPSGQVTLVPMVSVVTVGYIAFPVLASADIGPMNTTRLQSILIDLHTFWPV